MKAFTLLTFLLVSFSASAQWFNDNLVEPFETEFRAGYASPFISSNAKFKCSDGASFGWEARLNLETAPVDFGIAYDDVRLNFSSKSGEESSPDCRVYAYQAVSHVNFRRGAFINPFAGISLGVAELKNKGFDNYRSHYVLPVFSIRAGLEIWHHLRIMASVQTSRIPFNNFQITVGIVLGGRPKHDLGSKKKGHFLLPFRNKTDDTKIIHIPGL